jgi:outer membrane protein assembly factor BamB
VGAYYVHGIALYDTSNGTEIWRRKDLKEVQTIRMSIDGERILCGFEGKSFEPLDLKTGRSKPAMRGVKDVIESIYDDLVVIDRKGRDYKLTNGANKQIAALPRATPATLDFAFGPQRLCISDCAGSVRCFDTNTGEQIWEHNPGNGIHALELTFNESGNAFAGITWPYEKGGVYQLVNLHPDTGDMVTEVAITNAHEFAFCCKGSRLLSSDGSLRDTATGNVVALLEFFPTEKPPG